MERKAITESARREAKVNATIPDKDEYLELKEEAIRKYSGDKSVAIVMVHKRYNTEAAEVNAHTRGVHALLQRRIGCASKLW